MINPFATTVAVALGLLLPLLARAAEPTKSTPAPAAAAAANRAPSGPANYDSFRLIHTRNVFDPDRRPIRPPGINAPQVVAPTQADYAALTGTMVSTEKTYAFFSGSRPDFNKVLSVGGQFVRATIASITAQSIEIERDGKRTTILVGQTVPFDNLTAPGDPPVEAAPAETTSSSVSAPAASSTPAYNNYRAGNYTGNRGGRNGGGFGGGNNNNNNQAPAPAAAPAAPPGNIEEIRRRMMEKRQQELK